jgi:uncharacterized Zn ribbon protein|tara:strand:+ start:4674 stop:4919 length:246 start_codon:yes stop_codon:yes gene_type:complete
MTQETDITYTCDQCTSPTNEKSIVGPVYRFHLATIETNDEHHSQIVCEECAAKIKDEYFEEEEIEEEEVEIDNDDEGNLLP